MRTSPLAMRLPRARCAPVVVAAVLTFGLVATACGGDDGDDDTSPTTTSPTTSEPTSSTEGDPTTTATTEAGTTTAPPGDPTATTERPGGDTGLTAEEFDTEVRRRYGLYSQAFVGARQRNALDEQFRAELATVYFPALVEDELDGLNGIGGIDVIVPQPGAVVIDSVEMEISTPTCASGSARFDLRPIVGDKVPGPVRKFFKLETSEAQPGWRFAVLGSTAEGGPVAGSSCEEA